LLAVVEMKWRIEREDKEGVTSDTKVGGACRRIGREKAHA